MGRKGENLIGRKFNYLEVLGLSHRDKNYIAHWLCRCDCGNESIVAGSSLKSGRVKSCGCGINKRKHKWIVRQEKIGKIITTNGFDFIIDNDDFDKIKEYSFSLVNTSGKQYIHCEKLICGKRICFKLHRLIMNCPDKMVVDHINGNTLDNRKCNLRICNIMQNCHNSKKKNNNTSGYKGVHWSNGKWRSIITVNYHQIHLGYFDTPELAYSAYCKAAKELHGEYAHF